jgi:hypothetical protein
VAELLQKYVFTRHVIIDRKSGTGRMECRPLVIGDQAMAALMRGLQDRGLPPADPSPAIAGLNTIRPPPPGSR